MPREARKKQRGMSGLSRLHIILEFVPAQMLAHKAVKRVNALNSSKLFIDSPDECLDRDVVSSGNSGRDSRAIEAMRFVGCTIGMRG